VLITGESGTGKELIARGIHHASPRRDWLFVPLNCGAIPATMMESELFGHERGAFTGANQRRTGKLELANGGTLFLDEVAELPLDLQVKLLRVLEDRTFTRVGGNEEVRSDVRFLAATHRDLAQLVAEGKFREDLFFRLRVLEIRAAPLREHLEDLPELVDTLLERLALTMRCVKPSITPQALELLQESSWPGNVRELRNVLERTIILGDGREIRAEHLTLPGRITGAPGPGTQGDPLLSLKDLEREHVRRVLKATGWNKTLAAEILGIGRPTIYEKIKAYDLEEGH
jgi:Nif-specific regulatory protein